MAFIGANRLRLRHLAEAGNATAARYLEAFRKPEGLLSTAMMGVTIAHITASSVATWALIPVIGPMAAVVVTAGLTPLMLIVREVMVPLVDVAALPDTATPDDAVRLIAERGFSRIPIFTDRIFNIVGVVTAMDLLRTGAEATDVRALVRPATYVPETKQIDDL